MGFLSAITREAGTSPSTRRRPGRRLSGSHLFIGLVAVLAFAFNYLALQDREATILVAVASRALPAGSPLQADDVRFVPVPSEAELSTASGAAAYVVSDVAVLSMADR